jgi:hypothetical protein
MTLFEELKTNGIPPQIDRSVLRRFSGGLGAQLVMAMKSLGLIDDGNRPTTNGERVIRAFGTDEFKPLFRAVLESGCYPFLDSLDLQTATPSMFADAFKATGAKEDVLRKCRTFYLHAAQFAGVPIGPRIAKGGHVPSGNSNGRRKKEKPPRKPIEEVVETHTKPHQTTQHGSFGDRLLDKFPPFNPSWPPEIQTKWFEGYERLLAMGGKGNGGNS